LKSSYKLGICTEEGEKVFGEGPFRLLCGVERNGSLHRSAQDMNMAYSKAHAIIRKAEKELGFKILISETGGKSGGGSIVTLQGRELMKRYGEFRTRASLEIERIYLEIFSG